MVKPLTSAMSIVRNAVGALGFALVGVTPARATDHEDYVRRWLADQKHGEMGYLAEHVGKRLDPTKFLPAAKSVICVADRYPADDEGPAANTDDPAGRLAKYAWGDDYHNLIKKRLHQLADALRQHWPDEQYRAAVDTAPVLERDHAQRAGLGWIGKHTLLIHPELGSWLLLGQIVTTLAVDVDSPSLVITDHCGSCTRCIDACPTDCISPYQLDASRCISYLTIEHRGPIDPSLHKPMGDWVAGCDICQQVCPFNDHATKHEPHDAVSIHPRYTPRPPAPAISLIELLNWNADARRRAFTGSALKRIKLDQMKRNAIIAAGNYLAKHQDEAMRNRIEQLADDFNESDLVRQTARQSLDRLNLSDQRL